MHPTDRSLPVDLVRIDAIYNPVRRANFTVAETRVGQRTDYDRLTVSVETNGTITPEDAIAYAAALAQDHFRYFVDFGKVPTMRDAAAASRRPARPATSAQRLGRPIDDFGLSVRSLNSLKNSNIRTLKDLVEFTEDDLLKVKNVGEKALERDRRAAAARGAQLRHGVRGGRRRAARRASRCTADGSAVRRAPGSALMRHRAKGRQLSRTSTPPAGDAQQHGDEPVRARPDRSPPRPRPRSCGPSPRSSSPWRAGVICTRAVWSERRIKEPRHAGASSSPRSARGSPRGPAGTPGSSSSATGPATARTSPGSSCSPSDRRLRAARRKEKGDPSGPLFLAGRRALRR